MTKFILIIVFSLGYKSGGMTVVSEFDSFQMCEDARMHIAQSHGKEQTGIISQGCYRK